MPDVIQMQSLTRSRLDESRLAAFDQELIEGPTQALIHQEARFLYFVKGRGTLRVQDRDYPISPGAMAAILPWQITQVTEVAEPLQYYLAVYQLDTLNRLMKAFYGENGQSVPWERIAAEAPVTLLSRKAASGAERLILELKGELGMESALDRPPERLLTDISVMNALVALAVLYTREARVEAGEGGGSAPPERTELLRYLYAHCSQKLTLKKLSGIFYMSQSAISSYLTGVTGLSFFDLVNEMRIGKTANYLLYTDLTIEELSGVLGYVDASHISKVFSARVGMRIGEYRALYGRVSALVRADDSRAAYRAVEYIYRHYQEPITAQQVAEEFHMRVSELNRVLLNQVERNFEEFLHLVRVNHACKLLASTNMRVVDVALAVGYNSPKTMTRSFLSLKRMTPQTFRRRLREGAGPGLRGAEDCN